MSTSHGGRLSIDTIIVIVVVVVVVVVAAVVCIAYFVLLHFRCHISTSIRTV